MKISMIAAIGKNRALGKGNELLWRIPDDLKRVRSLTMGHPLVMGRKTFDSIGKPLPGRTSVVITRDSAWQREGVFVAHSVEEAIETAKKAPGGEEVFVFGGAEIYRQALSFADKLYLTLVDDEKEGDSYFPSYESEFTKIVFEESHDHEVLKYRWVDIER